MSMVSPRSDWLPWMSNSPDVHKGGNTEDEEAPLEGGGDESSHEPADDNHPGEEGSSQDVGEGESSGEQEYKEKEREVDEPLDVANILS